MLLYCLVLLMKQIDVLKRLKLDIFSEVNNDCQAASSWKLHMRDVIVPISDQGWNCYELDSFPKKTIYLLAKLEIE